MIFLSFHILQLSPLLRHSFRNSGECFCSIFSAVGGKHTLVALIMFMCVRTRRTPCSHRLHNIGREQWRQSLQPKASFLAVWVSILIRLHSLRIRWQTENFTRHWVFYANLGNVCPPEPHKQVAALNAQHYAVSLKLVPFPEMPCAGIAQICAGRVRNEQVPSINVMPFIIHRLNLPSSQGQQSIAKDVPFRVTARWFLNVAGVGFVSFCPESIAYFLRFLTGDKHFHLSAPPFQLPSCSLHAFRRGTAHRLPQGF